jgi:hypothetical protein
MTPHLYVYGADGHEPGQWPLENGLETKQITRYDGARPRSWHL